MTQRMTYGEWKQTAYAEDVAVMENFIKGHFLPFDVSLAEFRQSLVYAEAEEGELRFIADSKTGRVQRIVRLETQYLKGMGKKGVVARDDDTDELIIGTWEELS